MTDKFMSGWGLANGKINKLVFVCDDSKQANIVYENSIARSDMKNVNICYNRPSYPSSRYYTQIKTIADCPSWYKENYFKKG